MIWYVFGVEMWGWVRICKSRGIRPLWRHCVWNKRCSEIRIKTRVQLGIAKLRTVVGFRYRIGQFTWIINFYFILHVIFVVIISSFAPVILSSGNWVLRGSIQCHVRSLLQCLGTFPRAWGNWGYIRRWGRTCGIIWHLSSHFWITWNTFSVWW